MDVDQDSELTGRVIGAAIAVHRELGPGAEEISYEEALSLRLREDGVAHVCQRPLRIVYKGAELDAGYRLDLLIEDRLPVELKAVESVLPIHEAQILTYMRLGGYPLGLLLDFEVPILREGIRRMALSNLKAEAEALHGFRHGSHDNFAQELILAALEVRRNLGSGLLRSTYEACFCHELSLREIDFQREVSVPLRYGGHRLSGNLEIPLLIRRKIPVVSVSVSRISPLHEARLLGILRNADLPSGFIFNFSSRTGQEMIRCLSQ